jgi:hypothetical protein
VTRTATLPKPGHSSALMPVSGLFEIPIFDSTYAREATAAPTSLGREGRGTEGQTGEVLVLTSLIKVVPNFREWEGTGAEGEP